jgi:hypothetical protein
MVTLDLRPGGAWCTAFASPGAPPPPAPDVALDPPDGPADPDEEEP